MKPGTPLEPGDAGLHPTPWHVRLGLGLGFTLLLTIGWVISRQADHIQISTHTAEIIRVIRAENSRRFVSLERRVNELEAEVNGAKAEVEAEPEGAPP